jgi:hypothetical protein
VAGRALLVRWLEDNGEEMAAMEMNGGLWGTARGEVLLKGEELQGAGALREAGSLPGGEGEEGEERVERRLGPMEGKECFEKAEWCIEAEHPTDTTVCQPSRRAQMTAHPTSFLSHYCSLVSI